MYDVSVKECPAGPALLVNSLLTSATTDHGPATFHEPDIPPPFKPKHPHCPGPALVRTQWYAAAASPLIPSCAITPDAPANSSAAKTKIDRIAILLNPTPPPP
jgi:hypothetical protein